MILHSLKAGHCCNSILSYNCNLCFSRSNILQNDMHRGTQQLSVRKGWCLLSFVLVCVEINILRLRLLILRQMNDHREKNDENNNKVRKKTEKKYSAQVLLILSQMNARREGQVLESADSSFTSLWSTFLSWHFGSENEDWRFQFWDEYWIFDEKLGMIGAEISWAYTQLTFWFTFYQIKCVAPTYHFYRQWMIWQWCLFIALLSVFNSTKLCQNFHFHFHANFWHRRN